MGGFDAKGDLIDFRLGFSERLAETTESLLDVPEFREFFMWQEHLEQVELL